jgi:excisionase family DNA binding protein
VDAPEVENQENNHMRQPLLLTAEQAATALAICRTKVYELLRNGELESVQIGASRRIPTAALEDYVQRLRDQHRSVADTRGRTPTVVRRTQGC